MFAANVLVAGWVGLTSLFAPTRAQSSVFEGAYASSGVTRMVGALWTAIFILSLAGLFYPEKMNLVFLLQLIYKGTWLLVVAIPAAFKKQPYPKGITWFFLVWVILLPWVIQW